MITKRHYVEYLVSTPVNYTASNPAKHLEGVSHDVVRGVGVVNLVHSDGSDYYPIDYRIYALDADGKTKNDHFHEMLPMSLFEAKVLNPP